MADDTTTTSNLAPKVVEDQKLEVMEGKPNQLKRITFPLTMISFLLSLPVLFSVVWLIYMRHFDCENLLQLPKVQMGIVIGLICIFFVSNLAVYLRSRFPILGLLLVMLVLLVMLTVGLALVGAYKMESRTIPGTPKWLKTKIMNNNNWDSIESCIFDTRTCKDLVTKSYTLKSYDFTASKLSPIESGCCKPPANCGMEYVNATFWRKGNDPADGSNPYNIDCDLWVNDVTVLCYNCNACKEGFRKTVQGKWRKLGLFLVVMAIFLIIAHLLLFVVSMWEHYAG